ncbi:hypothetical protein JTB14_031804 [Gonioctena quinquepunctata]|nr:hypothetical protein JTB14_031804 [Gonioctena quinquepunctata]
MTKFIVILAAVALSAVFVYGDPTHCYECNIMNHSCNSPINLNFVGKQDCSKINTNKNTTSEVICFTVTAKWIGGHVSERGCYYSEMENEDVCSYFKRTEASGPFTKDFTCKTCSTDYCNND